MVHAEKVQNRGVEIRDGHFVLGHEIADFVRLPVMESLLHSGAPGQKTGERRRMIIAAR
jgi:hypothetical protein